MVMDPKDFLGPATKYEASLAGQFAKEIDDAARRAWARGWKYFTVPTSDLPVGVGRPKRNSATEPYERVLDTWRNAGDKGWTIIPETYGQNETRLVFLPNP